ncbi:MAG: YraN family protein [Patescibacteria group bacterium]|nr:MAG: YraN family protein [Patescibacteria group bacterium]
MDSERKVIGNKGEDLAAAFLRSRGFRILERNARVSRIGEIDIVALDRETLVFVEVKTRHDVTFGSPEEAVTASKLRTLAACAESWQAAKGWTARPYRIDVIAVDLAGGEPAIRHLESVGG